jgi:hypothetical protein
MKDFAKIIREKGLPEVGQQVRNKKYGTIWRVMEKKEVWANIEPDPKTGDPRMIPAIYLNVLAGHAGRAARSGENDGI